MKLTEAIKAFLAVAMALSLAVIVVLFTGFSHDPEATQRGIEDMQEFAERGKVVTSEELDKRLVDISKIQPVETRSSFIKDVHSASRSSGMWVLIFSAVFFWLARPRLVELAIATFAWSIALFLLGSYQSVVALLVAMAAYFIFTWMRNRARVSHP